MCPKGETVNASEIQLIFLTSTKNLEEHIAGGINIFFKHIKSSGNLSVSWKGQEFFFLYCGLLLLCTFCILSCLCILVYLQRTLGKPAYTGVFLCGKEPQKQLWTEAIFAKKQQNLLLGVLTVTIHPRVPKEFRYYKGMHSWSQFWF